MGDMDGLLLSPSVSLSLSPSDTKCDEPIRIRKSLRGRAIWRKVRCLLHAPNWVISLFPSFQRGKRERRRGLIGYPDRGILFGSSNQILKRGREGREGGNPNTLVSISRRERLHETYELCNI
jgi:hypothetical protein